MILLFTDYGMEDPYVGQMHAALLEYAPGERVIDLTHNLPAFDVQSAAYFLPAYCQDYPSGTVIVGVVDPGVGGQRRPIVLKADNKWYVGPDNGLFSIVTRRATQSRIWEINWRPENLSSSFHGRDLFAPVAAKLAQGELPEMHESLFENTHDHWPDDLSKIIYIDHFGNLITGLRASIAKNSDSLLFKGKEIKKARTFSEVGVNNLFWYENANGLIEIAANQKSARKLLGAEIGDKVKINCDA